jgi:hypothetical protein
MQNSFKNKIEPVKLLQGWRKLLWVQGPREALSMGPAGWGVMFGADAAWALVDEGF